MSRVPVSPATPTAQMQRTAQSITHKQCIHAARNVLRGGFGTVLHRRNLLSEDNFVDKELNGLTLQEVRSDTAIGAAVSAWIDVAVRALEHGILVDASLCITTTDNQLLESYTFVANFFHDDGSPAAASGEGWASASLGLSGAASAAPKYSKDAIRAAMTDLIGALAKATDAMGELPAEKQLTLRLHHRKNASPEALSAIYGSGDFRRGTTRDYAQVVLDAKATNRKLVGALQMPHLDALYHIREAKKRPPAGRASLPAIAELVSQAVLDTQQQPPSLRLTPQQQNHHIGDQDGATAASPSIQPRHQRGGGEAEEEGTNLVDAATEERCLLLDGLVAMFDTEQNPKPLTDEQMHLAEALVRGMSLGKQATFNAANALLPNHTEAQARKAAARLERAGLLARCEVEESDKDNNDDDADGGAAHRHDGNPSANASCRRMVVTNETKAVTRAIMAHPQVAALAESIVASGKGGAKKAKSTTGRKRAREE